MYRRWLVTVVCLVLLRVPAEAQEWNAQQREVLNFLKDCTAAWASAAEAHDMSIGLERCPFADDAQDWYTPEPVPGSSSEPDADRFRSYWGNAERVFFDFRPLSVKINGNVALVMYYLQSFVLRTDGTTSNLSIQFFEAFQRNNGRWEFLAGMGNPVRRSGT